MGDAWLILETSGRSRVGVAVGGAVASAAALDGGRQHNRLLLPTIGDLLRRHGLTPRGLTGVAVGTGPGSYTGLRVGLTAAKTLAYALRCSLAAVPTFTAIAADVPGTADVIADALQGAIYVQRFADGVAVSELRIERFDAWVRTADVVAGPGVVPFADQLPAAVTRSTITEPSLEAVFRVARTLPPLGRDALLRLEPLYLRGSSAEEKAKRPTGG
jgi:tRNA threonylcarbamoyladenosine biosynthesis protein TsaB